VFFSLELLHDAVELVGLVLAAAALHSPTDVIGAGDAPTHQPFHRVLEDREALVNAEQHRTRSGTKP
jgi:hypothetical protein